MTGKAHLSISALLCQCFAILVYRDLTPIPLMIGAFFGLMADIDEPQSKISYMLIKGFGGKQKIGGVNARKTDTKHNQRLKRNRQIALTAVLILIGLTLAVLKLSIFFTLACFYISILPWTTHRTLSHSLTSSIVVGLCMFLGFNSYGAGQYGIYCGIGYFLHIFEDSFTVTGTPLFYPFSDKRYKIPLMSTGSTKGKIVEMIFVLVSLVLCGLTYLTAINNM